MGQPGAAVHLRGGAPGPRRRGPGRSGADGAGGGDAAGVGGIRAGDDAGAVRPGRGTGGDGECQFSVRPRRFPDGAGPDGGGPAGVRPRLAGGELVRRRPALRVLHRAAAGGAGGAGRVHAVVGRGGGPGGGGAGAAGSGAGGLWRNAGGCLGGGGDPGDDRARAEGDGLSLPADDADGGERAGRSVHGGCGPAGAAVAGADHRGVCAGGRGVARRDGGGGSAGGGVLRHGLRRGLQRGRWGGELFRPGGVELPTVHSASRGPRGGGRRGGRLLHRVGDAGADDPAFGLRLPGGHGAEGAGGGGSGDPRPLGQGRLRGGLDGVCGPHARRDGGPVLPPRPALVGSERRFRRGGQLCPAVGLARRRGASGCNLGGSA